MKFFIPVFLIFISFYSCSRSVSDISKNMRDVLNISDEIRTYFLRKPDYWGLSTKSAITDKIISEKFVKDGKIILSGGAEVLIGDGENAEPVMPSGKTFDIVMRDLNKAKCTAYAEFGLSENDLLALVRISIINRSGKYLFEWGGENPLPVKKYFAKDFCKTCGNTIIWSIK